MRVRVPPRAARRHEYVTAHRKQYVTAHRTQVQVFDEKRGKMRAEDITGGITADGYDAPRARFDDQVCFDFMKGRCTRGASCRYSHDPNASGWDPNFGRRGRSPSPRRRYDSRDRYDDRRRSPPRRCAAASLHMLSWPNGQGVSLLRRRLRVQVPPRAGQRDSRSAHRRSPPRYDSRDRDYRRDDRYDRRRSPPRDRRDDYDRRDRYDDRRRSPPRDDYRRGRSPPRSPPRDEYRDRRRDYDDRR